MIFYFQKKKYRDIEFVENGGWHFTNVKTIENIDFKMKNYLHHLEYEESGLNISDIKKIISKKEVLYDLAIDSKSSKWSSKIKLENLPAHLLPEYVFSNLEKYRNWID